MATVTVTSKGQITLPVEIRRRLGLKKGSKVELVVEEGKTVLRPKRPGTNPFEAWVGAFPAFSSKEEINAWIREMRGDDFEAESQP
ncbi:MAG TPA: AbrB/MazE/SpoVT family DNA-binding domain-containing protein [Terracidiphilus sp.]|jgi:AbrB family looped-hinge helix DNA binding protein